MRLQKVYSGHGWKERLKLFVMGRAIGANKLDALRTLLYRPEYFGTPFGKLTQQVMRGPSEWSVGERELMAAFVSKVNQCPF